MKKITVVGSFVMDLIGTVDEFPMEGQTVIGKTIKIMPGGKGANQAISASRLGGDVSMLGMVGNDPYGDTFKALFKESNIDITNVMTSETEPTAVGLIQLNRLGENKIVVIPGANYEYSIKTDQATKEILKKSDIVIAQLELKHEVVYRLIDLCYELNIPLILNPAPAVIIDEKYLQKITYLTPNETELEILSGLKVDSIEDAKIAIKKLLDLGVKNVIATLGSKGALIGNSEGFKLVNGYKVKVMDSIGAGDAFNGALSYCIVNGYSLLEAVKYANVVGALAVTKHGAIPSLPTKKEVECFINDLNVDDNENV